MPFPYGKITYQEAFMNFLKRLYSSIFKIKDYPELVTLPYKSMFNFMALLTLLYTLATTVIWINKYALLAAIIFPGMDFITFIIVGFFMNLIINMTLYMLSSLGVGLVGWSLAKLLKQSLSYSHAVRMSVYGMTLPIIITPILVAFSVNIPLYLVPFVSFFYVLSTMTITKVISRKKSVLE